MRACETRYLRLIFSRESSRVQAISDKFDSDMERLKAAGSLTIMSLYLVPPKPYSSKALVQWSWLYVLPTAG